MLTQPKTGSGWTGWGLIVRGVELVVGCYDRNGFPTNSYIEDPVVTFLCHWCGAKIIRCTPEALDKREITGGRVVLFRNFLFHPGCADAGELSIILNNYFP